MLHDLGSRSVAERDLYLPTLRLPAIRIFGEACRHRSAPLARVTLMILAARVREATPGCRDERSYLVGLSSMLNVTASVTANQDSADNINDAHCFPRVANRRRKGALRGAVRNGAYPRQHRRDCSHHVDRAEQFAREMHT